MSVLRDESINLTEEMCDVIGNYQVTLNRLKDISLVNLSNSADDSTGGDAVGAYARGKRSSASLTQEELAKNCELVQQATDMGKYANDLTLGNVQSHTMGMGLGASSTASGPEREEK